MDIRDKYISELQEGRPIAFKELFLYPVLVRDWHKLRNIEYVLKLERQRLPARFTDFPYLKLLFIIDSNNMPVLNDLYALIELCTHKEMGLIKASKDGLLSVGDVHVKPFEFERLKNIIAIQNCIELPKEHENPDIADSESLLRQDNNLCEDYHGLLYRYAEISGTSMDAVLSMSVYELSQRILARSHIEAFRACLSGETSGLAKFTGGNPFPSWCFKKEEPISHGMISLEGYKQKHEGVINFDTTLQEIKMEDKL